MNRALRFDLDTNQLPVRPAYRVLRSAMTRSLPVTG